MLSRGCAQFFNQSMNIVARGADHGMQVPEIAGQFRVALRGLSFRKGDDQPDAAEALAQGVMEPLRQRPPLPLGGLPHSFPQHSLIHRHLREHRRLGKQSLFNRDRHKWRNLRGTGTLPQALPDLYSGLPDIDNR
jgi:hypothetical protein